MNGHLAFNSNTLHQVDRIMVFYLNTEEMQIETLLDKPVKEAQLLFSSSGDKYILSFRKLRQKEQATRSTDVQKVVAEGKHAQYTIRELESGTIHVLTNEKIEPTARPILRNIAKELGVTIFNVNGNPRNTRQLGSMIIRELLL